MDKWITTALLQSTIPESDILIAAFFTEQMKEEFSFSFVFSLSLQHALPIIILAFTLKKLLSCKAIIWFLYNKIYAIKTKNSYEDKVYPGKCMINNAQNTSTCMLVLIFKFSVITTIITVSIIIIIIIIY